MSQSYANHTRIVPPFHFGVFGIFAINLVWRLYWVVRAFSVEHLISALMAIAIVLLFFYARLFALTVQDRVIRMEERLRLKALLPADLQGRIKDFTIDQLVALRFASDAELPDLARRVLTDNLTNRKAIKQLIKVWNPDLLRA